MHLRSLEHGLSGFGCPDKLSQKQGIWIIQWEWKQAPKGKRPLNCGQSKAYVCGGWPLINEEILIPRTGLDSFKPWFLYSLGMLMNVEISFVLSWLIQCKRWNRVCFLGSRNVACWNILFRVENTELVGLGRLKLVKHFGFSYDPRHLSGSFEWRKSCSACWWLPWPLSRMLIHCGRRSVGAFVAHT